MQKVRIIYQKILSPVKRLLLQKSSEARFATPVVCSFFESNINPENIKNFYLYFVKSSIFFNQIK
ncbi:GSCOCG00010405001-RA-CDS [Cotesia congregata]|nr:GSCOCG00010405001-RA-CDS [Cotesia congregata]